MNKKNRSTILLCCGIIFFIGGYSQLFATSGDTIKNKIGISVGVNRTTRHIKSNYAFIGNPYYQSSFGYFVEGYFSRRIYNKIVFETKVFYEQRDTRDSSHLVFTDIVGNTTGAVSLMQKNHYISISPMLLYQFNRFLSVGIGPSINYLTYTSYRDPYDYSGGEYELNYYKKFQPEINVSFKLTINHFIISYMYSRSLTDMVKGTSNGIKEYDRVHRVGLGYLINIKNKSKK